MIDNPIHIENAMLTLAIAGLTKDTFPALRTMQNKHYKVYFYGAVMHRIYNYDTTNTHLKGNNTNEITEYSYSDESMVKLLEDLDNEP